MIELWHCKDSRSFRVLWTLEALQLPYTLHVLPFPPRTMAPDYLEINPLGTIPSMRDGEVFMTESVAIVQYLAARYPAEGLAVAVDEADYGDWLNWHSYAESTLTFPLALVLRYTQLEPGTADKVVNDYSHWFAGRLRHVERTVSHSEWLCGQRFTTADIAIGYALLFAEYLGLSDCFKPPVATYWKRLQQSHSFKRARQVQSDNEAK